MSKVLKGREKCSVFRLSINYWVVFFVTDLDARIAVEIAAKIASVNGPSEFTHAKFML